MEESAGCVLIRRDDANAQALVIRVRSEGFEIPKGHLEAGETREAAAIRELSEETGLISSLIVVADLGVIEYSFERDNELIDKCVTYFAVSPSEHLVFEKKPNRTRELRWVTPAELDSLPFVNEALRDVIRKAFSVL